MRFLDNLLDFFILEPPDQIELKNRAPMVINQLQHSEHKRNNNRYVSFRHLTSFQAFTCEGSHMVYHNQKQDQGKQERVNEESDPSSVVVSSEGSFLVLEVIFDAEVVDLVT